MGGRRVPGQGRGRGKRRGEGRREDEAAFNRSRDFVLKIRGMAKWDWRGVMRELEAAEAEEGRIKEVEGSTARGVSVHAYNSCLVHLAKGSR